MQLTLCFLKIPHLANKFSSSPWPSIYCHYYNNYLKAIKDRHVKIKEDNLVICGPSPKCIQSLLPIQRSVNMDFGVNSFDKLHHNEEVVGRIVNTEDP